MDNQNWHRAKGKPLDTKMQRKGFDQSITAGLSLGH